MSECVTVSVIMPVFNAERYLKKSVESVLNQTYADFQLILVDDGSTDKSSEICDEYSAADDRIFVIHQDNKGEAGARNAGIMNAVGAYIVFLDSDDWWSENFLSEMIDGVKNHDTVICEIVKVLPDGSTVTDPAYNCDMSEWCWPVINNYSIACWRCIFNRDIIVKNNILFTEGRRTGADQEFTYKYMLHTNSIAFVPEAVYYYRINSSSVMFTANYNHFDAVEAIKAVERYAFEVCDEERAKKISDVFKYFKYPYLLEFAILTVLTAGEKTSALMNYLSEHGYSEMLDRACRADKHYESEFMTRWKKSPKACLRYYRLRKNVGNVLRRLKTR